MVQHRIAGTDEYSDERGYGVKIFTLTVFIILSTVSFSFAQTCRFRNPPPTAMNFGNLSPANTTDAIATSTARISCTGGPGSAYPLTPLFSDDNGQNGIGSQHRMQNTVNTTQYLPYAITYPVIAVNDSNAPTSITITGTISAVDYQNAWVGGYSDTVTITINP
jgi:spore coat protein U-like protein